MSQGLIKATRLLSGESFITSEKGNSMTPLIKSGQKHRLESTTLETTQIDDIVFCKVHGRYFTHKVTAKCDKRGVQISNNHGHVNGCITKFVPHLGLVTYMVK